MQFSYVAFFFLVAVAVARSPPTAIHEKCQNDPATHVDDSVFDKLRKGEKIDDPHFGPHVLCMNVGHGIQKANGDIDTDALKKYLPEDVSEDERNKVVAECGQRVAGSTAADAAVALTKCLRDHLGNEHDHHGHEHHH